MRFALLSAALLVMAPAIAHAEEEEEEVNVKLGRKEEIGVVVASAGGAALGAGAILLAMGLDRRLPPGETADEIYIATAIMISGAVFLGVGIPLAFMGHAERVKEEKEKKLKEQQQQKAWIVPTFGGVAAVVSF